MCEICVNLGEMVVNCGKSRRLGRLGRLERLGYVGTCGESVGKVGIWVQSGEKW
jgi:hypothetical protein